jgi:hypothetical protein
MKLINPAVGLHAVSNKILQRLTYVLSPYILPWNQRQMHIRPELGKGRTERETRSGAASQHDSCSPHCCIAKSAVITRARAQGRQRC